MDAIQAPGEIASATNDDLADAVKFANPLILRGLLFQLTGDESLVNLPIGTMAAGIRGDMPAVVDPDALALIHAKAVAVLEAQRDAGGARADFGPMSRLHRSMELAVGCPIPAAELDMWVEQLALEPLVRGLKWRAEPDSTRRDGFLVAVIGAGMSGLNAAVQLKSAGIPYVVLEKNGGVGGTWHENRYPGARVDSPSRTYFNAFGVDFALPYPFCVQAVNERFFNWTADHFQVRDSIELNTEVKSAIWDEAASLWEVQTRGPDGPKTWRANAVITGVGFLNRPNRPPVEGAETFAGLQFHTTNWPAGLDLAGKRVAVIGSGATSYQMTPVLAKQVGHMSLFQRTPRWVTETAGYLKPFPPQTTWLDRNFPYLTNFNRFYGSWRARPEALMGVMRVDPEHREEGSVSAENKRMRDQALAFMHRKLAGRPDLIEKMTPSLPPMTSRPVLVDSDDNIYDALLRDNVALVTDPITAITPHGVRTADGVEHGADIIVWATGFKANDYLYPMDIRGQGGLSLGELWSKDGARAYLGTMLPGFPNLFTLYGPNMNPFGTGLSVTDLQEMQTRFALKCCEELILTDRRSVSVKPEAYERFNAELDRNLATMVYADPRITNYYRNDFGRCSVNSGFDVRLMWRWLRDPSAAPPEPAAADPTTRPYFGADLVVG
jgi:4-hydroxyacetophenone monooxygenase